MNASGDDVPAGAGTGFCQVTSGRTVEQDGRTLYYEVLGGGSLTPLVVLNGGPGVGHDYLHCSDVWDRLATMRPTLLYDPRGTGRSSRLAPDEACTYRHQLEDLEALRACLGWERVDILGHSFGGNVAMGYAARHPERVRRLVLVDSGDPKDSEATMLFAQVYPDVWSECRSVEFAEALGDNEAYRRWFELYNRMLFYSPDLRDAFLARAAEGGMVREVNEQVWQDTKRYDLWPELPKLTMPVLVITGRFDANVAPSVSYGIHKAIPGSRFVVFERSGHKPFYEEPDAFERLVGEFLA